MCVRAGSRVSRVVFLLDPTHHSNCIRACGCWSVTQKAANVEAFCVTLQQPQARMQFEWCVGSSKNTTRETREPARTHIVHGKVSRNAHGRESFRRHWTARPKLSVEVV